MKEVIKSKKVLPSDELLSEMEMLQVYAGTSISIEAKIFAKCTKEYCVGAHCKDCHISNCGNCVAGCACNYEQQKSDSSKCQ